MRIMRQSPDDDPVMYFGDGDGLATGAMGGCVSVIALYGPPHHRSIIGQHGAGGIGAIDFAGLVRQGRIPNVPATKFFIIWAPGMNSVSYEILTKLKDLIEDDKVPNLGLCQFAVYTSGNALVTPTGQVFDIDILGTPTNQLQPKCQFILKFIDKLKNVFG